MKEGWTYKKFDEVFNLQMGKTPSRDNLSYWGGDNIWVSIADLKGKYVNSTKEHITDIAVSESGIHKVPKGTAIMSFKLTIGRSAITQCDLFTNEAIMSFEPKETNCVSSDYVYYFLQGCKWNGANKAVMGQTLNKKTISANVFAYPSLETQSQIVSELNLIQSIIDKQKAQLRELDNLAQTVFYDMFGAPVANEKGWKVNVLGKVCELKAGKSIKASELSELPSDGLFPCFGGNGIRGYIAKKSHTGSFPIIGRQGALCGNVNMANGTFYATEHAVVCTPSNKLHPIFLFYVLKEMNLNQYAKGVAQPGLAVGNITPLPIILPPLSLQQSFAAKIESIEKQKAAINKSIEESQKLFDYTMDKYFG